MKTWLQFKKILPEIILFISTIGYWLGAGWTINYIAIFFMIALAAQVYFKKTATGLILGLLFSLIFGYLFLALFSDVVKFDTLSDALPMIIGGMLYIGTSFLAAIFMTRKYIIASSNATKAVA